MTKSSGAARWSLLADGSLTLQVDPRLRSAAEPWVPLCATVEASPAATATIDVRCEARATAAPRPDRPTLKLGDVEARMDRAGGRVLLVGPSGACGTLDLARCRSVLRAADPTLRTAADLYSMLTMASAFMLGRLDRALVHAAAVVAPMGGAWLLVGDARAGKTTTSLNLVTSGWNYLSDDQVVLSSEGAPAVEGWLRRFHVDAGWTAGRSGGRRESVDPGSFGPGQWQPRAPLAGVFVLDLQPAMPTKIEPLGQAEALAAIVRQSPWLLADPGKAPILLDLLGAAARRPTFRLSLGGDTYRDGARLLACLRSVHSAV